MWHISLAYHKGNRPKPLPLEAWKSSLWEQARKLARSLLAGVGEGDEHWYKGNIALHLRRQLTTLETGRLNPDWLLLPAVDGGTPEEDTVNPHRGVRLE